jgi:hypothetical protein
MDDHSHLSLCDPLGERHRVGLGGLGPTLTSRHMSMCDPVAAGCLVGSTVETHMFVHTTCCISVLHV